MSLMIEYRFAVNHYNWSDVALEPMSPVISRQVIHGQTMTVARIHLRKGAVVPLHQHVNEQISMLERGRVRFVISGEERIVESGEALTIPPNAPHLVEALEDSLAVDLFSPVREDWIRGDDAYLRGSSSA
jgi:quercetin dioxygenase-like cupin family protein